LLFGIDSATDIWSDFVPNRHGKVWVKGSLPKTRTTKRKKTYFGSAGFSIQREDTSKFKFWKSLHILVMRKEKLMNWSLARNFILMNFGLRSSGL
jgi:hypothetical protein